MSSENLAGLTILLLEDDLMLQKRICAFLTKRGAEVSVVGSIEAARTVLKGSGFDFALIDVNLPDGVGTELLKEDAFLPDTGVIVMTAHGGVQGAVEAMRHGALDYLVKPFEQGELLLVIERARGARQSARAEEHRREEEGGTAFFFGSALASLENQLKRILEMDHRAQGSLPPILIHGETGTGKTAIARWLHARGPRGGRELVEVNCPALPDTLAESELFGHEKGAFTDARQARMGLFEAAEGGSLFLDELASLSLSAQAKVLTTIEDHKVRRVGATRTIEVDVRIIAATNRDLKFLVSQGQFREDLYHRLDLYRIIIPPLRERGDDILRLAEIFADRLTQKHRLARKSISPGGKEKLSRYRWPGNVRELAHEVERAVVFEDSEELCFEHLPIMSNVSGNERVPTVSEWLNPQFRFPPDGFVLDEAIDTLMRLALDQASENVSGAARLLGVPRDFIRYRLGQKGKKIDGN